MIRFGLYDDAVPEALAQQIIGMSARYTTDLAMDACPPDHPLYPISQINSKSGLSGVRVAV